MKTAVLCSECPYKLGLVHTLVNPCPQCRLDNYKMFEVFKSKTGYYSHKQDKDEQKNN